MRSRLKEIRHKMNEITYRPLKLPKKNTIKYITKIYDIGKMRQTLKNHLLYHHMKLIRIEEVEQALNKLEETLYDRYNKTNS